MLISFIRLQLSFDNSFSKISTPAGKVLICPNCCWLLLSSQENNQTNYTFWTTKLLGNVSRSSPFLRFAPERKKNTSRRSDFNFSMSRLLASLSVHFPEQFRAKNKNSHTRIISITYHVRGTVVDLFAETGEAIRWTDIRFRGSCYPRHFGGISHLQKCRVMNAFASLVFFFVLFHPVCRAMPTSVSVRSGEYRWMVDYTYHGWTQQLRWWYCWWGRWLFPSRSTFQNVGCQVTIHTPIMEQISRMQDNMPLESALWYFIL